MCKPLETEDRQSEFNFEDNQLHLKYCQQGLIDILSNMSEDDRVEAINDIKKALHEVSPFRNEPVDCVTWVKSEKIVANEYNPNKVAPPKWSC
jgi:hypothetical protein